MKELRKLPPTDTQVISISTIVDAFAYHLYQAGYIIQIANLIRGWGVYSDDTTNQSRCGNLS